jgi:peroxiredoxin Q/BCP
MALQKGTQVPDFTAELHNGEMFQLSKAASKYTVLYFYPKDDTPGCTAQACGLRDSIAELEKASAKVYGIGKGDKASHNKFIQKHNLNFPLIVDEGLKICEQFGVLKQKSMFGKKFMSIARTTFIIDNKMNIVEVFENVNPVTHAGGLLAAMQKLEA